MSKRKGAVAADADADTPSATAEGEIKPKRQKGVSGKAVPKATGESGAPLSARAKAMRKVKADGEADTVTQQPRDAAAAMQWFAAHHADAAHATGAWFAVPRDDHDDGSGDGSGSGAAAGRAAATFDDIIEAAVTYGWKPTTTRPQPWTAADSAAADSAAADCKAAAAYGQRIRVIPRPKTSVGWLECDRKALIKLIGLNALQPAGTAAACKQIMKYYGPGGSKHHLALAAAGKSGAAADAPTHTPKCKSRGKSRGGAAV